MSEPRFLVVRLGSLGDIVQTFPAVSGLRKSFPQSEIVWLAHPKWESLVSYSGLASEVWTVETRNWIEVRSILKRIRAHRFAAAIDYQGLWKSAAIPFLANIPRRIGFSSESVREWGVPILYTEKVRTASLRHVADQNGELSLQAGSGTATSEVTMCIPEEDHKILNARLSAEGVDDYIVLSPGGGWRSKCWPAERYGLVAGRMMEVAGLRSVINVGPGEQDLASIIERAAGASRPVRFNGSLGQLMALLKGARAVLAGDTGPLHLADALGAPVVAIFGPTDPGRNGPFHRQGMVLRWEGATTTYKREKQPDESLLHIRVEEVMNAVLNMLSTA
jgi:lipopolysaccharide heptosyltransferase I